MQANAAKLLMRVLDPHHPVEGLLPHSVRKALPKSAVSFEKLPRALPESCGIPSSHVISYVEELLADPEINLHNLLIVCDGKVIFEGSFGPFRPDVPHAVYSQSKTVTSLAVAMLCDEGILSLDERIVDIFSDKCSPLTMLSHKNMTVRHLLTMTSGAFFNEAGSVTEENWLKCFLETTIRSEPGKVFLYNSLNTYMLSEIVRRKSGQGLGEFLEKRLFEPLGIADWSWELSPTGVEKGGWGLEIRPEDMAKIGLLFLGKGEYHGKRIVSEKWISEATKVQSKTPSMLGNYDYGYQLWVSRTENSFLFNGFFGQDLLAYPDNGLLVATNADLPQMFQSSPYYAITDRYFGHGFVRTKPFRPGKDARKLKTLSRSMDRTDPRSRLEKRFRKKERADLLRFLDGKTVLCEGENASRAGLLPLVTQVFQNNYAKGIRSFRFTAEKDGLKIGIEDAGGIRTLAVGFDRPVESVLDFDGEELPIASDGVLMKNEEGKTVLLIRCFFLGNASMRKIRFLFEGEKVTVSFSEDPGVDFVFSAVNILVEEQIPQKLTGIFSATLDRETSQNRAKAVMEPVLTGILLDSSPQK